MMKAAVMESKAIKLQLRCLKAAYEPLAEEDTLTWQMVYLSAYICFVYTIK